jgi:uncharacterized membrane protein
MAEFLAITFDTDQAEEALKSVRALESGGQIGIEDTAAEGKVTIHNEASTGTETGAVVGAVLGGLLFVIFPVAGIVGGAVAGGLVGRAAAPGLDGKFVKEVGDDLPAGGSALFLQIKGGGNPGLLVGAMRQYQGRVRQTSLPDEVETALDESLR